MRAKRHVLDSLVGRMASLGSRLGRGRPTIAVTLTTPVVRAGDAVSGGVTATAGERPVAVRPLHLVVEEYWPESVAGSMADMSSDTLATIEVSEGFDLLPGESRRFDFSVTVPLGARVTRGELDVSPMNEGCRVRAHEHAPLGRGADAAAFMTVLPPRIVGAVQTALTGAGFFARPVENRRRRDYVLNVLRPRGAAGGVDEMGLAFRVEPDRCFCYANDERTVARALVEGWGPPPKERPDPIVVELPASAADASGEVILDMLSPLFDEQEVRLSGDPAGSLSGPGAMVESMVESWIAAAVAKGAMLVLTGARGSHVHVWAGGGDGVEVGVQDVGSLLPEAAVRELAAREFQPVETGGRARVYVRAMAGASAADLTDAVLTAFHDIIGEERGFEPSVLAFD